MSLWALVVWVGGWMCGWVDPGRLLGLGSRAWVWLGGVNPSHTPTPLTQKKPTHHHKIKQVDALWRRVRREVLDPLEAALARFDSQASEVVRAKYYDVYSYVVFDCCKCELLCMNIGSTAGGGGAFASFSLNHPHVKRQHTRTGACITS